MARPVTRKVERICVRCGRRFERWLSQVTTYGTGQFCGTACSRTRVMLICDGCGASFEKRASEAATARFCGLTCSHRHMTKRTPTAPDIVRIWRRVDVRTTAECWLASGPYDAHGDAMIKVGSRATARRNRRVHRLIYESVYGWIPGHLWVLHHCDRPPCANPHHLYVGTDWDNARDRTTRQRGDQGDRHTSARLTETGVRKIRRRWAAGGVTINAVAREYGVCRQTILAVISRRSWKHVP